MKNEIYKKFWVQKMHFLLFLALICVGNFVFAAAAGSGSSSGSSSGSGADSSSYSSSDSELEKGLAASRLQAEQDVREREEATAGSDSDLERALAESMAEQEKMLVAPRTEGEAPESETWRELGLNERDLQLMQEIGTSLQRIKVETDSLSSEDRIAVLHIKFEDMKPFFDNCIQRLGELRREKNDIVLETLKPKVIELLQLLSSNKVFFSDELLDYRLRLNAVQPVQDSVYGKNFDVSRINSALINKLLYFVSSYQTEHSCGFHVLANAQAIDQLAREGRPITFENVRRLAESFIVDRMIPNYGEETCIRFKDNTELYRAAGLYNIIPAGAYELNPKNLFLVNVALYEPISDIKKVKQSLIKTMSTGKPMHFMVFYNSHWTLLSVAKNPQNQLVMIYLDSLNPYALSQNIVRAVTTIDQIIEQAKKESPGVGVVHAAGRAPSEAGAPELEVTTKTAGASRGFGKKPVFQASQGANIGRVSGVGVKGKAPIASGSGGVPSDTVVRGVGKKEPEVGNKEAVAQLKQILEGVEGEIATLAILLQEAESGEMSAEDQLAFLSGLESRQAELIGYKNDIEDALRSALN